MPQTSSEVETFQTPLSACKKKTVGPGFTRTAAHSVPDTVAQLNLTMVAPVGRAFRMVALLHRPVADAEDVEELLVLVLVVGLAVGEVELLDEQPVAPIIAIPAAAVTTSVLLTLEPEIIRNPSFVSTEATIVATKQ